MFPLQRITQKNREQLTVGHGDISESRGSYEMELIRALKAARD
jgi:hypothetical protein